MNLSLNLLNELIRDCDNDLVFRLQQQRTSGYDQWPYPRLADKRFFDVSGRLGQALPRTLCQGLPTERRCLVCQAEVSLRVDPGRPGITCKGRVIRFQSMASEYLVQSENFVVTEFKVKVKQTKRQTNNSEFID